MPHLPAPFLFAWPPRAPTLPRPPRHPRLPPALGHLPAWGAQPLSLLEQGYAAANAAQSDIFGLDLGLPAVVGFSPAWNKALLSNLTTFQSSGSFSSLVPYLNGGIITADAPQHKARRGALNPSFGKKQLAKLRANVQAAVRPFPSGPTNALAWADETVLRLLNAAYFSGDFDEKLLHQFVSPLRRPFPAPMLPRPRTLAAVRRELLQLGKRRAAHPRHDLLSALIQLEEGLIETRISLAAAHDTTTHALAYVAWHLAQEPRWHAPKHHQAAIKEVLRLYPPGWMGSRRLARDFSWAGHTLPAGTLALYSTYLTHRSPALWPQAATFNPARWEHRPPAWAYLPFGGGERLCLGMHLAHLILEEVLAQLPPLRALTGNPLPSPALTLGPTGPLWVTRAPP